MTKKHLSLQERGDFWCSGSKVRRPEIEARTKKSSAYHHFQRDRKGALNLLEKFGRVSGANYSWAIMDSAAVSCGWSGTGSSKTRTCLNEYSFLLGRGELKGKGHE